jgi:hypothetical protein
LKPTLDLPLFYITISPIFWYRCLRRVVQYGAEDFFKAAAILSDVVYMVPFFIFAMCFECAWIFERFISTDLIKRHYDNIPTKVTRL